jgi:Tol biopolymer transport system component
MTRGLSLGGVGVALVVALAAPGAAAGTGAAPRPEAYRDQPPAAYVSSGGVVVVDGDGSAARKLPGTAGACCPSWSPDGAYLAFQRDRDLWVVEHDGHELHRVATAVSRWEWAPDGQALAVISETSRGGIDFYGASDPNVRDTELLRYHVRDFAWAGLGRRVIVSVTAPGSSERAELFMLEVPGPYGSDCPALCPERPVPIPIDRPAGRSGPLFAGWSPNVDAIALWSTPDDSATLGLLSPGGGSVVPIATTAVRRSWVQWSRLGDRLLVVAGPSGGATPRSLLLCSRLTSCQPITGSDEVVADPTWSSTGAIAYVRTDRRQLWIAGPDGGGGHAVPAAGDGVAAPHWLPDAHHVVFVRDAMVWLIDVSGGDATPIGGPLATGAADQLYSVAP